MAARRERRYLSPGSRWGAGKVHRMVYDPGCRVWHLACQKPPDLIHYGAEIAAHIAVTCKVCARRAGEPGS